MVTKYRFNKHELPCGGKLAKSFSLLFEVPEINGIIFTQTAEHSVSENI
jgi:hypothetical protein